MRQQQSYVTTSPPVLATLDQAALERQLAQRQRSAGSDGEQAKGWCARCGASLERRAIAEDDELAAGRGNEGKPRRTV